MLGPIIAGDKSILDHDLTHATSGLALYPAFDTGWREGDTVIAPELVTVTRHSGGPDAGWSLYATGASGLRYYITHLRFDRVGAGLQRAKGARLGTVGNFPGARVPHAHVGVNAEALLGAGRQLRHNTNYTHGQPTIGSQISHLLEDDMPPWFKAWFEWRLFDGKAATRPTAAPDRIEQKYLDIVEMAERFRAEKPDTASSVLRDRLARIHTLSAP